MRRTPLSKRMEKKLVDEILDIARTLVPEKWNLRKERSERHPFNILDSYNGALLSSQAALLEFPGKQAKIELLPGKIEARFDDPLPGETFEAGRLPHGELQKMAGNRIGSWRLGRRAEGIETVERYRVENEKQKGVARLLLRFFKCWDGPPAVAVEVRPYRGYENEVAGIRSRVEALYPLTAVATVLFRTLPDPIRGLSEPLPNVRPDEDGRKAVANLGRYILERVRLYEPGIADQGDTEVLHQYRVAIRRMRSLVALLEKVFRPDEQETLRSELKSAMQGTNRLRDLDVQLADLAAIRPSLPAVLQPGLDRLMGGLRTAHRREFESVYGTITATPFDDRFARVTGVLETHSERDSGTIADMLASVLEKRYRRIARETRILGEDVEPKQLHSLRVSCKKLRYLMDFFPQLLQQELVAPLHRKLKKLQDLLGRHNDLCVREAFLLEQAKLHRKNSVMLMAIGAVIMQTHRERHRLVNRCVDAARAFCSTENKQSVRNALRGN